MDPPATHQSSLDLDWLNYFDNIIQDDQPLLRDDMLEHSCNLSEKGLEVLDQKVSPLKQDQHINISECGLQEFDPFEDLSFWDCWGDGLPVLSSDDDSSVCLGEATCSSGAATTDHGGRKVTKRLRPLELQEIEKYFDMPIVMAAKELSIGLTVLKKRCRELNIKRWPHRKLKSLQSLIKNVKELGMNEEIEMLEVHKSMMEKLPDMNFTERTKKLRQACFKATYKKRRLNSLP